MSTRRHTRQTARQARPTARPHAPNSLYRRPLRFEPLEDRRLLAVITVNTLIDGTNFNDTLVTLREAVYAANTVPGADTIEFAPSLTSSGPAKINLAEGEIKIVDALTINGPGANLLTIDVSASDFTPTVNDGNASRIFNIDNGSSSLITIALSKLSLTGGDIISKGGAIYSTENLTISDCVLFDNAAIGTTNSGGGAIAVANGSLTINRCKISGNTAGYSGGGIEVRGGSATITESTIDHNTAPGGGGLYSDANLTLTRCTIDANQAAFFGGGVCSFDDLSISGCTISDNTAEFGAAVYSQLTQKPGVPPKATISNSTISGNVSTTGGAVFNSMGLLTVNSATITKNSGGLTTNSGSSATLTVYSSIVAGNVGQDVEFFNAVTNTFDSDGYNVIGTGNATAKFTEPGDQTGVVNLLIGPLAANGGPTLTHALLPGSPAINAGKPNSGSGNDQRGPLFSRVFDGRIDIGAFELQQPADQKLVVSIIPDESDGNYTVTDLSLRETILLANSWLGNDTIRFASSLTAAGPATIPLTLGELGITSSLTIIGPGADNLTINGSAARIFSIDDGSSAVQSVSISGLTLTGAASSADGGAVYTRESLTVANSVFDKNFAASGAGIAAILTDGANLTVSNSTISNNLATVRGAGVYVTTAATSKVSFSDSHFIGNSFPDNGATTFGAGLYIANSGNVATIRDTEFRDNASSFAGGGLAFVGLLSIERSSFNQNAAHGPGGGIYEITSPASGLILSDSHIVSNAAAYGGGLALNGTAPSGNVIARTEIANNSLDYSVSNNSTGIGGGIYLGLGALSIIDSEIRENSARNGGGIGSFGASALSLVIEDSTIYGNSALNGGGINLTRSATIRQSTIGGNSATTGGGIFTAFSSSLTFSTVAKNVASNVGAGVYVSAGAFTVNHSIVAHNSSLIVPGDFGRGTSGQVNVSFSLIGDSRNSGLTEAPLGSPDSKGNLIGGLVHGTIDPLLRPISNYGGPTSTFALSPGSPAYNAGDAAVLAGAGGVPLNDQRGAPFDRILDGRIDIGAVEFHAPPSTNLVVDILADEFDSNFSAGDVSLREALYLANLAADANTITFSPALFISGNAVLKLTLGALDVVGSVTIIGPGQDMLTIDASGSDSTPDVADAQGDSIFVIHDEAEVLFDATISGLTLTGGDALYGGAILSTENLSLQNCTITGNHAQELGGGLAVLYGNVTIDHCVITNNATSSELSTGGGIAAASAASLHISNSTIAGNTSAVGGGIHAFDTPLDITNSTIADNSALGDGGAGGGIYQKASALTLADSTVSGNLSISGGGVYSDGDADITRTNITNNYAYFHGGGVYSFGALQLHGSTITSNSAALDGGGLHAGGDVTIDRTAFTENSTGRAGGGAWIEIVDEPLSITYSTFTTNFAGNEGAGLWITGLDGAATIANTLFDSNATDDLFGLGAGLTVNAGTVELNDSIFTNNTASAGGGIYNRGNAMLIDTTVSDNTSTFDGGGIYSSAGSLTVNRSTVNHNAANRNGGGIYSESIAQITSSTIAENGASRLGGGLVLYSSSTPGSQSSIAHSTVAKNYAGDFGGGVFLYTGVLRIDHSIIAANLADGGIDLTGLLGSSFDAHYNLIGNNANTGVAEAPIGSPDANGNLIGGPMNGTIDPKLGQLAIYAGPTATYPLLTGSPAINAGSPTAMPGVGTVPQFDQRGTPFTRVYNGRIDFGAVESQPNPLPGDYNFNNTVDAADYIIWRKTVGSLTDFRADGNGDLKVDNTDYNLWRSNFGQICIPPVGQDIAAGTGTGFDAAAETSGDLAAGHSSGRYEDIAPSMVPSDSPRRAHWTEEAPSAAITPSSVALLNCLSMTNRSSDSLGTTLLAVDEANSDDLGRQSPSEVDTRLREYVIANWVAWRSPWRN